MKRIVWFCGLLLLITSGSVFAKKQDNTNLIIIDEDVNATTIATPSGSGSGDCPDDDDDCEQLSGSGLGTDEEETTTDIITVKNLSSCEQIRQSILENNLSGDSILIPTCLANGEYRRLQCNDRIREHERECWCVDKSGRQITGTQMKSPLIPDCEHGTNLLPCIYWLVQSKQGLTGDYTPRCLKNGQFEKKQCTNAKCYCVDQTGLTLHGSERPVYEKLDCDEYEKSTKEIDTAQPSNKPEPTEKPHHKTTEKPDYEDKLYVIPVNTGDEQKIDSDEKDKKINVEIGGDIRDELSEEDQSREENYSSSRSTAAEQIMNQPGLLAAIISGAVVGLLCAVLLIMFIVYRMRKKDEGSYALDEPKKYDNIAYTKAPDKEFYA